MQSGIVMSDGSLSSFNLVVHGIFLLQSLTRYQVEKSVPLENHQVTHRAQYLVDLC